MERDFWFLFFSTIVWWLRLFWWWCVEDDTSVGKRQKQTICRRFVCQAAHSSRRRRSRVQNNTFKWAWWWWCPKKSRKSDDERKFSAYILKRVLPCVQWWHDDFIQKLISHIGYMFAWPYLHRMEFHSPVVFSLWAFILLLFVQIHLTLELKISLLKYLQS